MAENQVAQVTMPDFIPDSGVATFQPEPTIAPTVQQPSDFIPDERVAVDQSFVPEEELSVENV